MPERLVSGPRGYVRGGPVLRWLYGRWIQVLAFGDLLGRDKRPSRTTLAAVTVLWCACYVLVRTLDATGWLVTLIFGALLLLWSRAKFGRFAERIADRFPGAPREPKDAPTPPDAGPG